MILKLATQTSPHVSGVFNNEERVSEEEIIRHKRPFQQKQMEADAEVVVVVFNTVIYYLFTGCFAN